MECLGKRSVAEMQKCLKCMKAAENMIRQQIAATIDFSYMYNNNHNRKKEQCAKKQMHTCRAK